MSSPYSRAAQDYFGAGWFPIPLPPNAKDPVPNKPTSFTGEHGQYVSERQMLEWSQPKARFEASNVSFQVGNIALRLSRDVIGIDVDAYGEKRGADTLAAAEEEWGQLPPTYVSTSREDGISGIRFFRVPEGLAWPGELPQGKGVELLQWMHRYAIVAPSTNPQNGRRPYKWFIEVDADDGRFFSELEGEIPEVSMLPGLPQEWVDGLTQGKAHKARALDDGMGIRELQEWLNGRPHPNALCDAMRKTLVDYTRKIRQASDDGGAHDAGRNGAWALLGDAKAGHCGVVAGLTELRNVFLAAVEGRRADVGAAKAEWTRFVTRGAAKVTADENPEILEDPCGSIRALRPKGAGRLTSADINWRLDDVGNAERLIRVMDNRARWVDSLGWMLWTGKGWALDTDRQVARWAVKAINGIEEELAFLEGDAKEDVIKAFKAHKKSSSTSGKLDAMQTVAKGRKGITVGLDDFDADPRLLACGNGVVELRREGVEVRGFHEEQYITLNTGVDYKPEARSSMWDDFLDRFQPDEEVRDWLQRITGYSLLGANPARFLVALVGLTSSGKSTFASAVRHVLGGYAGPMQASVLRDNSDDKPRPDLLAVLPKRIIVAEELSQVVHLHADQIKRITGGSSLVSARGMRSNVYLHRKPAFTPWLVQNDPPTIEGADAALKRRCLIVPFDVQIPQSEEDPEHFDNLMREGAEAILAWCVEGYRMWRERPNLADTPIGALEVRDRFMSSLSEFHTFLSERCDVGAGYFATPTALYEEYEDWCAKNSVKERDKLSMNAFGRKLNQQDFFKRKRSVDGKQVWFWCGLRLVREGRIDA